MPGSPPHEVGPYFLQFILTLQAGSLSSQDRGGGLGTQSSLHCMEGPAPWLSSQGWHALRLPSAPPTPSSGPEVPCPGPTAPPPVEGVTVGHPPGQGRGRVEAPEWAVMPQGVEAGRVWSSSSPGPACRCERLLHPITAENPHYTWVLVHAPRCLSARHLMGGVGAPAGGLAHPYSSPPSCLSLSLSSLFVRGPPLCLSWRCLGPPAGAPHFLWSHAACLKPFRHSLGAQVTRALGLGRGCGFGFTARPRCPYAGDGARSRESRSQPMELRTTTPLSAQEGPHRPWGEVMCHPRGGGTGQGAAG